MENIVSPMIEEMELAALYLQVRLEDVLPAADESVVLSSIAVSLKRIADSLDRTSDEMRLRDIEVKMVCALAPPGNNGRNGRKTFSDALTAVKAFLEKKRT